MATLADAFIRLRPETRTLGPEIRAQTEQASATAGTSSGRTFGQSFVAGLKRAAIGVAVGSVFAGLAAGKFLAGTVAEASDLNETISKTQVIFGKSSTALQQWARNAATDMGQTQQAALDGAATFALYGKTAGFAGSKLFNFSTDLSALASDMASFSNTSPEEAIQAIGAAFRGESDPIEKYGVLLNEATLKQVALRKGIIETSKGALTPQQRILAVQAALYEQLGKKGSGTLGDFERTSAGLANQQRILRANMSNLRAEIGQALLPTVTKLVTALNSQVVPALRALWAEHGPAVTAFIGRMGDRLTALVTAALQADWGAIFGRLRDALASLRATAGPALADLRANIGPAASGIRQNLVPALASLREQGGTALADTINVGAVAMRFLAEHVDLLAKALPYVVGALVAFKVAQLAANVAAAVSPAIRIAEVVATRQQTKAIAANTAARAAETVATVANTAATTGGVAAENAGILARARAVAGMVAHRVAMLASTAASWLMTAASTALGVAVRFALGPIGLIITAIGLLVAGIIYAYRHNETFRRIVQAAWTGIKAAAEAVVGWFVNTAWPFLQRVWNGIVAAARAAVNFYVAYLTLLRNIVSAVFGFVGDYIQARINFVVAVVRRVVQVYQIVRDVFERARAAVVLATTRMVEWVASLPGRVVAAIGALRDRMLEFGRDIIDGIAQGIRNAAGRVVGALTGAVGDALAGAKRLLGIGSPSKVAARQVGEPIGEGVAVGIVRTAGRVAAAVAALLPSPPGPRAPGAWQFERQALSAATGGFSFRPRTPPPVPAAAAGGGAGVTRLHPADLAELARLLDRRPVQLFLDGRQIDHVLGDRGNRLGWAT